MSWKSDSSIFLEGVRREAKAAEVVKAQRLAAAAGSFNGARAASVAAAAVLLLLR